jgi:hypothetical protein
MLGATAPQPPLNWYFVKPGLAVLPESNNTLRVLLWAVSVGLELCKSWHAALLGIQTTRAGSGDFNPMRTNRGRSREWIAAVLLN